MKRLSRTELTSRLGIGSREAELGRVMQDEEGPGGGLRTCLGRREVSGKDDRFVDARIAEESVSGLGGGPVLAGQGCGGTDAFAEIAEDHAQPALQSLIGELGCFKFAIDQSSISVTSNDLDASNFDQTMRQQETRHPERDTPDSWVIEWCVEPLPQCEESFL